MAQAEVPLSRRERRKLEVRERILGAAIACFDERGPAAATVTEISERADVAQKTFFNHFASKQQLLRDIAERVLEQLLVDIEDARKLPGSTRARIAHFFARIADNATAAGPMHRELLTELIHTIHAASLETEQTRRLQDAFGAIVRDGLEAGDLTSSVPSETLTEMLMGAFYVLMFNWANLDGYPLRERARAAARFLGEATASPGAGGAR